MVVKEENDESKIDFDGSDNETSQNETNGSPCGPGLNLPVTDHDRARPFTMRRSQTKKVLNYMQRQKSFARTIAPTYADEHGNGRLLFS